MKIDRRKSYYLIIDTETANSSQGGKVSPQSALVYDIGIAVIDKKGVIYESASMLISDVFYDMSDCMKSAYYAEKIPMYEHWLEDGYISNVNFLQAKKLIQQLCDDYNVKAIIAHNAYFDYTALTSTQRYLTKSQYRYFLPFSIPVWDTLKMAKDTICKQKSYRSWCEKNGYLTKNNQPRATAEILFRYISGQNDFSESHTGYEDILIEKEIFAHCMKQKKPMRKELFNSNHEMPLPVYVKSISGKTFRIGTNC